MKKTLIAAMFAMTMIITLSGFASVPTQAKTDNYTLSGYCGGMGLKKKIMKATYDGYKIKVSGYGTRTGLRVQNPKGEKIKTKTYKISKKCKVGAGGCMRTYKKFLKEEGRRGRLQGFVDIRLKNNQVTYIDYGF